MNVIGLSHCLLISVTFPPPCHGFQSFFFFYDYFHGGILMILPLWYVDPMILNIMWDWLIDSFTLEISYIISDRFSYCILHLLKYLPIFCYAAIYNVQNLKFNFNRHLPEYVILLYFHLTQFLSFYFTPSKPFPLSGIIAFPDAKWPKKSFDFLYLRYLI